MVELKASTQAAPAAQPYHTLPAQKVAQSFQSDLTQGLTANEVSRRRDRCGWNELTAKPATPAWVRFLQQFNQPLLYILLLAGVIKAFLGSWTNAVVIWGVTVINAIIGFVQESKAEGAIAALAQAVTTEATVIRNGQKGRVPSRELVPGDLVLLASGDKVPADLRLISTRSLQVDESALTGESFPVDKGADPLAADTPLAERRNMAYAGSFVTAGQGSGLVVAIANDTEMGQISQSLQQSSSLSTPLTRKFDRFSHTLLYGILALATMTFVVGLARGQSWVTMFEAAVALAVSAIPEGLPAVVTVTLAIGVNRMARRHAIIRKLPAVETLGGATVICSDKTGTLTENQMTVQVIYAGGQSYQVTGTGYSLEGEVTDEAGRLLTTLETKAALEQCLIAGLVCNDAHLEPQDDQWSVVGDPTEGALLVSARKAGLSRARCDQSLPRLDAIPFESQHQYMATLHPVASERGSNGAQPTYRAYIKGSVEAILQRCSQQLDNQGQRQPIDQETVHQQVEAMAQQGLRVLALASKDFLDSNYSSGETHSLDPDDIATDLVFLGLQGMIDPPRAEAIAAVQACQSAGIQVKMITGDHIATAKAIARQLGLGHGREVSAYEGRTLEQMDHYELTQAAEAGSVFARVAPAQKLRLVEALQAQGEIVAMTGDGVNDAPALRQADIGIAMGGAGTDVAKEAADMLLTDDNFASIEAAVEEGRTVYQNVRKAIAFILPVNGGESMTILISALLARDLPILSLQVLWLNMVNSVTMTVPLAFEPKSARVMQQPPRNPREPLLSRRLLWRILAISAFNWVLIFGLFEWAKRTTGDVAIARTMAIQALIAARIVYLLSISHWGRVLVNRRGQKHSLKTTPAIAIGIGGTVVLQWLFSQWGVMNQLFATAPLSAQQWLICLLPALPMVPLALLVNWFDPQD